jgi:hypothetical protein
LYAGFLYSEPVRIAHQREVLRRLRLPLAEAFEWELLKGVESGPNGFDDEVGFRVPVIIWTLMMASLGTSFLFEARLYMAYTSFQIVTMFAVSVQQEWTRKTVVMFGRLTMFHALYSISYWHSGVDEMHFRRALAIRTVLNFVFIESLHEQFLHLTATAIILYARLQGTPAEHICTLPFYMFFFCNLPLHVMCVLFVRSPEANLQF